MATTNTTNGIQLQSSVPYTRSFYFGTTGQTVAVNLSKAGGAFAVSANSPATEIANGWYRIALTAVDLNTLGDLAFHCTAASGGPAEWNDQVVTQLLSQFAIDGSGHVIAAGNARQNLALNLPFTMTSGGAPKTGLTVLGQRNFGSGYSNISGTITELGSGLYMAALQPSDTNSPTAGYLFTASGADSNIVIVIFSP